MRGAYNTARQALARVRQSYRYLQHGHSRGGVIFIHHELCDTRWGEPCNCEPRFQIVRPR